MDEHRGNKDVFATGLTKGKSKSKQTKKITQAAVQLELEQVPPEISEDEKQRKERERIEYLWENGWTII